MRTAVPQKERLYIKTVAVSQADKDYLDQLVYEQEPPARGRKKGPAGILAEIIDYYRNNK